MKKYRYIGNHPNLSESIGTCTSSDYDLIQKYQNIIKKSLHLYTECLCQRCIDLQQLANTKIIFTPDNDSETEYRVNICNIIEIQP